MLRNLFLFASLMFFACSDDSHDDLLDGTNYDISEKEDCNGIEYNPKTQFCSSGIVKDKGEFTDERDGKKYKYVEIGSQIWMAENLNYEIADTRCYDNNATNCEKCGRLYNWLTATTKDICPEGWRLPDDDDWNALNRMAGSGKEDKLSAKNSRPRCNWEGYSCTDDYGFSALACGSALYFDHDDMYSFKSIGISGYFLSGTETSRQGYNWFSVYMPGGLSPEDKKRNLYSVRCIKN